MRAARRTTRWSRIAGGVGAAAVIAALIAGCTTGSNTAASATVGMAAPSTEAAAAPSAASSAAASAGDASTEGDTASGSGTRTGAKSGAGSTIPNEALANRQVIRTASLTLEQHVKSILDPKTDKPDEKADAAARAAAAQDLAGKVYDIGDAAGGFRGAVNAKADTVLITLRVPVDNYDTVMSALSVFGLTTQLVEKSTDVTGQVVDLKSRIETMQASVSRVRALLAEAKTVGSVIAIESELTSREADLESLLSQQAALGDQVALSTITVTVKAVTDKPLVAVPPPPVAAKTGFLGGLEKGWAAAKSFGLWASSVLGAIVPFVPVVAVVLLLIWWIRRRLAVARRPVLMSPATSAETANRPTD